LVGNVIMFIKKQLTKFLR